MELSGKKRVCFTCSFIIKAFLVLLGIEKVVPEKVIFLKKILSSFITKKNPSNTIHRPVGHNNITKIFGSQFVGFAHRVGFSLLG